MQPLKSDAIHPDVTQHISFKIYALLFLLTLIWGLAWPISKIGLHYLSPIWFAALRLLIGMLSMFIVVMITGQCMIPTKKDMPIIIVMGIFQMALFMLLVNVGLNYVNAGRSAMLVYTTPIWVMPIAIFVFHEKINLFKWLGLVLGMLGIVILFNPYEVDWSNHEVLFGNGLLLLAALCWAMSILCARHMTWPHSPLKLIPWQLLIGTLPVLLTAMHIQSITTIQWNDQLVGSLLFVGILGTAFGYWGALVISKELSSSTASLSFLTVPVSGLLFSKLLLHEPITLTIILAMLLILSGVVCLACHERFSIHIS